ncbi:unnamed protein product [Rotaria socialis]
MRVITLYELELIDQSNGFDIILSPLPVINDEIRSSEQYKTIGRATRPLHISRSPVFERRRYDGRIAKTLTFDDTSNLNIRSICRSLRKRLESSKQNNHSNNQIENDLNEKSEETMSTSEKNVAKAQINAKENLELKLATQASAETANKERQQTHENNKAGKQCVHNETERGVTPLTDEYRHIIDALLDRPAITGQYTSNIPSEPILLQIDKSDLDFFQILMMESKSKTNVIAVETPDGLIYLKNMYHKRMIGKIVHSPSEQRARPIRGTHRLSVAEKLTSGLSPDQLRLKEQGHLTENNRKFGNHNLVDSSPHILQKIKEEQAKLINVGKRVPGYLQTITISPLRLILFTEGALILWNKIGSNVPISWDATGRIVMSRGKRVYYYELTVTNIASRSVTTKNLSGPSFPITSMLSSTHTTMDLVRWSPIVHSDGSLVFQLTAMRFFNGDNTMSAYLKRSWIIVNRKATNEDLSKTVVHSCFAHFSKSVKLQATKFFTKKKVAFVLWTMSLLVNSNTVEEMASMWEHICAYAADNVNNDPDKDNFIIRNVKVDSKGEYQYSSTLDQKQMHFLLAYIIGSNIDDDDTENSISEQNACDESESPFRDYFTSVFNDQKTKCAMFANENFQKYNENPYYNPDYLKCILSLYLPVAPIWSNLLMGNLGRYGYRNFEPIQHCGCHNSRTTGISESRLKVIKHTVLQGEVSSRIDQVVQILGSNIRQAEINYSNHYLLNLTRNRSMRAKKLLAEEPWNKRGPPAVTTTSIYSQKPKVSLVAQVKKALKIKSKADDVVVVSTGKNTFQFKPHPMLSPNQLSWLNSSIQLVLSNSCLVETLLNNFCSSSNAHNSANNLVTIISDTETNNNTHHNLYPQVEQITIQYLCDIYWRFS